MSRSNAAAINRRVNVPTAQTGNSFKPSVTNPITPQQPPSALTLPQVISVFDNRIMLLEKFMSEAKLNPVENNVQPAPVENNVQPVPVETNVQPARVENNVQPAPVETNVQTKSNFNSIEHVSINDFNTIISEFNSRFELFAHEISDLKDVIMKLQSYTMEVNKTLLEDKNKSNTIVVTNNNLVNTNEESLIVNNNSNETNESNNKIAEYNNTSIDLKNLIKQEFLQTN
jgi:hypothetical protein